MRNKRILGVDMRVKIDSVIKWIVILAIASALSLFKPLGVIASIFYFEYAVRWSMVLLAIVTCVLLIYKKKIYNVTKVEKKNRIR